MKFLEKTKNKRIKKMTAKNDFIDEHRDNINQEWNCYCNEINSVRHRYGLDSKVFTPNDKERFSIKYIESRLI